MIQCIILDNHIMTTEFYDAFERHAEDAETLFQAARWANADHLFGLATECGLKRLMLEFGMRWDTGKDVPQDQPDRVHVDLAWDRYEHYRAGYGAMKYVLSAPNVFNDWKVFQRYAKQSNFDLVRVNPHRNGCEEVRVLLQQAILDGIIL